MGLRVGGGDTYHSGVRSVRLMLGVCSWRVIVAIAVVGSLLSSRSVRAAGADSLIEALADPDPQTRQRAEAELSLLGPAARPAVIQASRCDSPAVASAAARVLLAMPWYEPDDPQQVKQLLTEYGSAEEPNRIRIAAALAETGAAATPALLRLVMEDPSEDVCWKIVTVLGDRHDPQTADQLRRLDPPDTRSAAMILAGRAWLGKDRQRAMTLFARAIEVESRRPTIDDGELDVAFEALAEQAISARAYDEAARLRRLQAGRIGVSRDAYPTPVFELFVLHARYGPLTNFDADLRTFRRYLGYPQTLYALSRIEARAGRSIEALAWEQAARAASVTAGSRSLTAAFLASAGWGEAARRELYAILAGGDPESAIQRLNARLRLASLARENDAVAIEHLSAAMVLLEQIGTVERAAPGRRAAAFDGGELAGQIAWRGARLAQSVGDKQAMHQHLDRLMQLLPGDPDVVIEACPLLKSASRSGDAERLFAAAYSESRRRLEQSPADPVQLNELAWLCARCDEKLSEALDLAQRAVAAEPDNPAFLDTLAEAQFRMGHVEEAVRLETQALKMQPGDAFIQKQLERFKTKGR